MSFDVHYLPCQWEKRKVRRKNPFTGKVQSVPVQETLADAEVQAVRDVLRRARAKGLEQSGYMVVRFRDGGHAEVFGSDELATGCMIAIRGMTPRLLRFLFDMLQAGRWSLIAAMENPVAVTTSLDHTKNVPVGYLPIVVCGTVEDLGVLLNRGFLAWKEIRDRVFGHGT